MKKSAAPRVTGREREILNAVFALDNRATAEEIRQRLVDPPGDSSVRVMLARLEKKGLLRHTLDGVRYVYTATRSSSTAGRRAVDELIETFFSGSMVHLMTALVRRGAWTKDELDTLQAAIDDARSEARRSKSEP